MIRVLKAKNPFPSFGTPWDEAIEHSDSSCLRRVTRPELPKELERVVWPLRPAMIVTSLAKAIVGAVTAKEESSRTNLSGRSTRRYPAHGARGPVLVPRVVAPVRSKPVVKAGNARTAWRRDSGVLLSQVSAPTVQDWQTARLYRDESDSHRRIMRGSNRKGPSGNRSGGVSSQTRFLAAAVRLMRPCGPGRRSRNARLSRIVSLGVTSSPACRLLLLPVLPPPSVARCGLRGRPTSSGR